MSIEYLGNKTRLLDFVLAPIRRAQGIRSVADLFCGTASVSGALSQQGFRVVANDHLRLCATLAEAALLADGPPAFEGIRYDLGDPPGKTRHASVLRHLDSLQPEHGFLFRTYSPASEATGPARMYLTEDNAAKADAIRKQIEDWGSDLTRFERALLLRHLVGAVAAVSNTAGTYGCFLKSWKSRALAPLSLAKATPPRVAWREGPHGNEVHCDDVDTIAASLGEIDAVYLDPPYTKRQYAAYYHLLETLVTGATPDVRGATGLPAWQERQSDFCYRRRAPEALARLVRAVSAPHVFLSYSEDGQIPHPVVLEILTAHGTVHWWERATHRYRSSARTHKGSVVRERLYHLAYA